MKKGMPRCETWNYIIEIRGPDADCNIITELKMSFGRISASEQREYSGDVGSRGCR